MASDIRTVTFINEDGDNPQAGTRKIDWRLYDGAEYSAVKQTTVNVVAANDAPTIANVGQTAAFTEGTPVAVDSDLTLGDVDSSLLKGATVTIKSYKTGDTLVFTNTDKITGTLAQSGTSNADYTLTLTGDASVSEYQTALRSVKFNNTSDTPDATNRTIEFNVTDSGNATLAAVGSATVSITAVNDAPILAAGGNTVQYSEQDTAVVINNGITLSDPEDTAINRVEIVLSGGGTGETLALPTNTKIEASFANNKLTLTKKGTETPTNADYQAALRTVTYENTNAATADGNRTITFTAFEGTGTTLASSGVVSTISVATLDDDAPVLDSLSGTTVTFTEGGTAAVLESALTVSDVDDTNLTKAIVRISEGYGSQDKLAATATAGFTIDWTAATGILEISGDKSLADWQAILRTVTFINEDGDNPQAGTRKIDWRLYDGANYSAVKQTTVNVVAANDAPTIANVGQTAAFTEGTPVAVDSDLTLGDVDQFLAEGSNSHDQEL